MASSEIFDSTCVDFGVCKWSKGIGKTDHLEQWSNLPNRTMSHTDHKGEKMANWYQSMRKESMQVYI